MSALRTDETETALKEFEQTGEQESVSRKVRRRKKERNEMLFRSSTEMALLSSPTRVLP